MIQAFDSWHEGLGDYLGVLVLAQGATYLPLSPGGGY